MREFVRVTEEFLEDGVVVRSQTVSSDNWHSAFVALASARDCVAAMTLFLLLDQIDDILISCECESDIAAYDSFLEAAWRMIEEIRQDNPYFARGRIAEIKEREQEIRDTGKL